ncbi:MAG TPA: SIR2 family protein [Trebonia sp.]|nr:SIR2 family protein [Trebonia sp.]
MEEADWDRLVAQLSRGDCTPFLGAGACDGTLPVAAEMSSRWAGMYNYPFPDHHDLPRVMQYISISDGDAIFVKERVCEEFASRGNPSFADSTEPHALLAGFPVRVFITTNYDDFLTKALKIAGKSPRAVVCPWYLPASADFTKFFSRVPAAPPPPHEPLVFHLHGNLTNPKSLVLTEGDYLEFLANIAVSRTGDGTQLVPSIVLSALTDYPLLFIGYSLQDWTFRVLFHGLLRAQSEVLRRRSVSVQLLPPVNGTIAEAERRAREYMTRYLGGWSISIFWGTAADFCNQLRARLGT